ncbi:uncharacterized protein LOC131231679 isoform X2 [Magnolia sinica]|uniref:uncharacterized protein LOC131231679 isoform X2 n=1 Tax=Magnolia sinica TaxID=86752 RepID=UPI0026585296|nr:uncharacterized protein LOC131231679 isoform X2 [Magnolia sinica]
MATWILTGSDGDGQKYECVYTGSGKTPLFCALGAFVALACAMVMKHTYILVAVSRPTPPALIVWGPDSGSSKVLTWQACFFFVTTWICFAVGEVLLMIGIGIESGHLKRWSRPRATCLVIRQGLFAAAGVFGLTTVFLAAGLYLTALRAQRLHQAEANVRREVLEASYLYASPARSPRHQIPTGSRGNSRARQENVDQTSRDNASSVHKPSSSV